MRQVRQWYLTDRLGSVTGITNATGALINSTAYDTYGHILSQSSPAVADSLGFTGREFDTETGLYYFRARYYNADLGRFQSEDPYGKFITSNQGAPASKDASCGCGSKTNPISIFAAGDFSLYRYTQNSPNNVWDSSGMDATLETTELYATLTPRNIATAIGLGAAILGAANEVNCDLHYAACVARGSTSILTCWECYHYCSRRGVWQFYKCPG